MSNCFRIRLASHDFTPFVPSELDAPRRAVLLANEHDSPTSTRQDGLVKRCPSRNEPLVALKIFPQQVAVQVLEK